MSFAVEVELGNSRTFSRSYSEGDDDDEQPSKEDVLLIQLLAKQAKHLPGNSWCEDWIQYLMNNHPVFGLCCHHPLHPVDSLERYAILVASISFGLAVASGIRLFFYNFVDQNKEEFGTSTNNTDSATYQLFDNNYTTIMLQNTTNNFIGGLFFDVTKNNTDNNFVVTISNEDLVSWTIGGALNTIFDFVSWKLSACACCLPGGRLSSERFSWCKNVGSILIILISLIITVVNVFLTILRANTEKISENNATTTTAQQYAFVVPYLIQVLLSLFFYYPIIHTLVFSGVLGCCGMLPCFGGRPREIRRMNKKQQEVI